MCSTCLVLHQCPMSRIPLCPTRQNKSCSLLCLGVPPDYGKPIDSEASTDTSFKVKKQGTEDGDFLHCADCWSTFLPTTKGTEYSFSTLLSASAALRHSQRAEGFLRRNCSYLSLLKNWKGRKPSLSPIAGSQQDTASFCTFCSTLLRLGVLVLTVLWKVETLYRVELLQRQPWHF